MPLRIWFAVFLLATAVAASGCNKKSTLPTDATPALPVASFGPPVTDDEAMSFGKKFVEALQKKDRAKFDAVMRMDDFWQRCVQDMGLTTQDRAALLKGMNAASTKFYTDLTSVCDNGGELKLLGVRTNRGRAEVVVRVAGPEGTNYFVCTPARFSDGSIAMEDLFLASSGEPMSLTLRRLLIVILQPILGSRARLAQKDQELVDNMATSQKATQAIRDKEFAKALALLKTLPASLRDDKQFALLAVMAGQGVSPEAYSVEIERFMKLFPGDPALDLMTIDYWLAKGDWKRGLQCVDRLDTFVGGDPFLNTFRVAFFVKGDRLADAKKASEQLLADEPKILSSYNMKALVQVKQKDFSGAAGTLKTAVVKFGALDFEPLIDDADYADFVKTKEFSDLRKWAAERAK